MNPAKIIVVSLTAFAMTRGTIPNLAKFIERLAMILLGFGSRPRRAEGKWMSVCLLGLPGLHIPPVTDIAD